MDPDALAKVLLAWDKLVVTLDKHRVGALIFLAVVLVICYAWCQRP